MFWGASPECSQAVFLNAIQLSFWLRAPRSIFLSCLGVFLGTVFGISGSGRQSVFEAQGTSEVRLVRQNKGIWIDCSLRGAFGAAK